METKLVAEQKASNFTYSNSFVLLARKFLSEGNFESFSKIANLSEEAEYELKKEITERLKLVINKNLVFFQKV
jgi:hypothetical protein